MEFCAMQTQDLRIATIPRQNNMTELENTGENKNGHMQMVLSPVGLLQLVENDSRGKKNRLHGRWLDRHQEIREPAALQHRDIKLCDA